MNSPGKFPGNILFLFVIALQGFGPAGCAPGISQQDLLKQIQGVSPPLIIDVRTPGEYKEGHVPGAVNISVFDFRSRFEQLNPPKDKPIIVICEHGPRSSFAGFMLKSAGYKNVFELDGAMKEWKKSNLPMEK
jgi:rhodanese-related sulfurtransferase